MVQRLLAVCLLTACLGSSASSREPGPSSGSAPTIDFCQRPEPGSVVPEPQELRSHDGVLQVDLAIHNQRQPDGSTRYCYLTPDGKLSPTLRLKPGELLILHLKNRLTDFGPAGSTASHMRDLPETPPEGSVGTSQEHTDPCASGAMTPVSTNLHFHGLTVPPVCHQDDVLKTSIQPTDPPFEYRLRIPDDEPPGLYWYHPQIHGFSRVQVLGGASGALIVEGIEKANPELAGLPERVLVIRDQDLLNPYAPPSFRNRSFRNLRSTATATHQQRHRLRQAGQGPVGQLRARTLSGLSARKNHDEAGRASAVACAECLGDHLPGSRRALRAYASDARHRRYRRCADPVQRQPGPSRRAGQSYRRAARCQSGVHR